MPMTGSPTCWRNTLSFWLSSTQTGRGPDTFQIGAGVYKAARRPQREIAGVDSLGGNCEPPARAEPARDSEEDRFEIAEIDEEVGGE